MAKQNPVNETVPTGPKRYRYYDFVMAAFVAVLLLSNLIGAAKLSVIELPVFGNVIYGAGILFFPLSYVIGDVLTEVYGYARARRVVWAGFGGLIFMSLMAWVVVSLPAAESWEDQPAYEAVFGQTPRIVLASILAFWSGEFANAYVLARMKIWTRGRYLWTRTIGSTVVGQGVDSLIFYPIAFYGIWENNTLFYVILFNCFFKITIEVIMTPVTYLVVGYLKKKENEDFYDTDTNFTPFSVSD